LLPTNICSTDLADYARRVLAECDRLSADDTIAAEFALPFIDLSLRFTGPEYASHCEKALVKRNSDAPAPSGVRLTIADAATDGLSPPASWAETFLRPLDIERLLSADQLRGSFFYDGRIWEFYDLRRRTGASLAPTSDAYPPWERSAPLRSLLHWAYAGLGLRLVHAATLGADGRGVLIAGAGGAGKSSTTLAGIVAGLDSVGDDYVLLDFCDRPVAYPLYRLMKIDPVGYRLVGLAPYLPQPGPLNWQGKYEFDFADLGRGRRADALRIEAILVANITRRPDTIVRTIGKREAMLALAPSSLFQLHGDRQGSAHALAKLVRDLPCFGLDLGSNPDGIADAIAGLIREVSPQ
jgi:hypothetical protein